MSPVIEVLLDDCYGVRRLPRANRILDIGGHVGLFSVAARIAHPSATIHCYEPNEQTWPYLDHQASHAGFVAFHEAVGGRAGRVSIEHRESEGFGWIAARTREDQLGTVPQISFEEAVERMGGEIDLAKIDCEGAEWSFLGSLAWASVVRVSIEYHLWPDHTPEEAHQRIEKLGFRVQHHSRREDLGLMWATRE